MESESRLERLETKVDRVNDELLELRSDFRVHTELIREHVAGDKKIINELTPILQEFHYRQERSKRAYAAAKFYGAILAICATILTIANHLR